MQKWEMLWTIYVNQDKVIVPTTAKTQAGYYIEIEPVLVASVADLEAVTRTLTGARRHIKTNKASRHAMCTIPHHPVRQFQKAFRNSARP